MHHTECMPWTFTWITVWQWHAGCVDWHWRRERERERDRQRTKEEKEQQQHEKQKNMKISVLYSQLWAALRHCIECNHRKKHHARSHSQHREQHKRHCKWQIIWFPQTNLNEFNKSLPMSAHLKSIYAEKRVEPGTKRGHFPCNYAWTSYRCHRIHIICALNDIIDRLIRLSTKCILFPHNAITLQTHKHTLTKWDYGTKWPLNYIICITIKWRLLLLPSTVVFCLLPLVEWFTAFHAFHAYDTFVFTVTIVYYSFFAFFKKTNYRPKAIWFSVELI